MSATAAARGVRRLTGQEIRGLDPCLFMAVMGKKVIHPRGRRSTRELLERGDLRPGRSGVAATAIEMAQRCDRADAQDEPGSAVSGLYRHFRGQAALTPDRRPRRVFPTDPA